MNLHTPIYVTNSLQAQRTGLTSVSTGEWLLVLVVTVIVVWLLIVIQAGSGSVHEFGSVLENENLQEENSRGGNFLDIEETESRSLE